MAISISVAALQSEIERITLIDVRRAAAREASAESIAGAAWRDPERVGEWAASLPAGQRVVVFCVHGHEVGQRVADALVARGLDARYLEGGIAGWQAAGGPVASKT